MLAFLKRRWILLSCAGVLLACSIVDAVRFSQEDDEMRTHYGIHAGRIFWFRAEPFCMVAGPAVSRSEDNRILRLYPNLEKHASFIRFHAPEFGGLPEVASHARYAQAIAPIWLLVSCAVGWLVIRELRWREKRTKSS